MTAAHAAPITTIATADVRGESHALMVAHREDAQRIYRAAIAGGLTKGQALTKAARAIKAGRRAQIQRDAELASVAAG
jgi:hypothetical protein